MQSKRKPIAVKRDRDWFDALKRGDFFRRMHDEEVAMSNDSLTGTIYPGIDQGAESFPVSSTSLQNSKFAFAVLKIGAS